MVCSFDLDSIAFCSLNNGENDWKSNTWQDLKVCYCLSLTFSSLKSDSHSLMCVLMYKHVISEALKAHLSTTPITVSLYSAMGDADLVTISQFAV